jgi:LysM repeat protein
MSNPSKEDIGSTIENYRRRRERIGNYAIGALAAILALVGIVLILSWLGGPIKVNLPFLTSPTPTVTLTPTPSRTPTPSATPTASPVPATSTLSGPITYIVQQGDLLGNIAKKYGVTIAAIMAANPSLTDPSQIFVGQRLVIPPPGSEPSPTALPTGLKPGSTISYLVQPGDSLQTIAAKFNSTAEDIQKLNNITDPNKIYPGLYLKVRIGIATPTPTVVTPTSSPVPTASYTPTPGPTSTRAP